MTKIEKTRAYFRGFFDFDLDIQLVLFSNLFSCIQIGIFIVVQPLYFVKIGFSSSTIGFLLGLTSVFSTIFLIPSGIVADRLGKKLVLISSSIAYLLSFLIYALFDSFSFLILASLLSGFSWGAWAAPYNALIADKVEQNKRSHAFSFSAFLYTLGSIIGSIIAGSKELIEAIFHFDPISSYKLIFWLSIALGVLAVIPLFLIKEEEKSTINLKKYLQLKSWNPIIKFSIVNAFIGLGAGLFITLVPLYMNIKFVASEAEIGALFAASNTIMALSFFVAPKLMEVFGAVKATVYAQSLAIILLFLIPFAPSFFIGAFLYVLRTILMNFAQPIFVTYAMDLVNKEERSIATSITTIAWNGTSALGTMLGGQIMEAHLEFPVFLCGISYTFSTILYYLFFKEK